jgi:mannitol-1-phosphate 5-dehydrogenase
MKLVQFGAGNIGRSFIGQLFSRAGWEVVFVDINTNMVNLLNEKRYYTIVIKREGLEDEKRRIGPVRAIQGNEVDRISEEIVEADLLATSVGQAALPQILPTLAQGISKRFDRNNRSPIDIILAENIHGAASMVRNNLKRVLAPSFPLEEFVGLVETSIGKMVPLMHSCDLDQDPLQLFAEEYETLILAKKGFIRQIPEPGKGWPESIKLVDNISAYVDQKLYIHNMGHGGIAYLGFTIDPSAILIADAIRLPGVESNVRQAMEQSALGLLKKYPEVFTPKEIHRYIEDLMYRFKNRALGDTIYRVGRDLFRKLQREDRLVGSMLFCAQYNLPFDAIAKIYKAALSFKGTDEYTNMFSGDEQFQDLLKQEGISGILQKVSGLDPLNSVDARVIQQILSG